MYTLVVGSIKCKLTHILCTHTTQHDAWEFVEPDSSSSLRPVLLFLRMLYFSTSTATLCGTSLIEPIEWYAGLTVSLQVAMLLVASVVPHCFIRVASG